MDAMKTISSIYNLSTTPFVFKQWEVSVCLTKMVGRKDLILQRMLRANGDNRLISVEGTEAAGALARLLAPLHLLFQHVKQCNDVTETAAGRGKKNLRLDKSCRYPGFKHAHPYTYL